MNQPNHYRLYATGLSVTLALATSTAIAGTAGTEFDTVWTTLIGWIEGTLGQVIAVTFILVGVVAGVAKGSIFGLVTGVAAGLGLITAPTVVDNIFTATLPVATVTLQQTAAQVLVDPTTIKLPAPTGA